MSTHVFGILLSKHITWQLHVIIVYYCVAILKNGGNTMLQLQEFPAFAVSLAAKLNFMWQAKLPNRKKQKNH